MRKCVFADDADGEFKAAMKARWGQTRNSAKLLNVTDCPENGTADGFHQGVKSLISGCD